MSIRFLLTFILAALFINADGQVRISLFYGKDCESVVLRTYDDNYDLVLNGQVPLSLSQGEILFICRAGDKVAVNRLNYPGYLVDSIQLVSGSDSSFVKLLNQQLKNNNQDYMGDFTFSSSLGKLKIVNTLDMDDYIAGVVQAEGGYKGHPEYFKTQAVIARTYACMHMGKHADEAYDLCDDVHCQVYHGISVTSLIDDAVIATKDQVITDRDSVLILTPFHSNCGGETVSSENVWLSSSPYLVSVFDPYCAFSRNAEWKKNIPKSDWLDYLEEKTATGTNPSDDLTFTQKSRMHSYRHGEIVIPLNVVRSDWNLRSTFFSISEDGDTLRLSGRGYGHGVGLCQEGAMVMASRGFNYKQILNFYYTKVYLLNIKDVKLAEREDLSF
jgi:stage II sporulation protein D